MTIGSVDGSVSDRPAEWATLGRDRLVDWLDSVLRRDSPVSVASDLPLLFEPCDLTIRRTLVSADRPAAHAAAREITVDVPGGSIRAAIIGAVATDPEFRRLGLGRRVVEAIIGDLAARGVSLAILWADVPSFYERLGFALAGRESVFVCPRGAWRESRNVTTRRARSRDLPSIQRLHASEICRAQRDKATWQALFAMPGTDFYVTERDGRTVAYGVVGKGHDLHGCLHEWGGDEMLLPVLVGGIFRLRVERELYVMSPPWKRQAATAMSFHGIASTTGSLAMFKVLDRGALCASIRIDDGRELPVEHDAFVRRVFGSAASPSPPPESPLPIPFYLFGLDSM